MYLVEVYVAAGIGYHRTRQSLDGILQSLVAAARATQLHTAIMSAYPVSSDFRLADNHKRRTAVMWCRRLNTAYPPIHTDCAQRQTIFILMRFEFSSRLSLQGSCDLD